jgi:hypothetical protein
MDLGAVRTLVVRHRSSLLAVAIAGLFMFAAFLVSSVVGQAQELVAGAPTASAAASSTAVPHTPEPQTPEPTATLDPAPIATAEPTAEPTPVPTPGPIAGWELAGTFDGGESIAGVHDVAAWNGMFVALGEAWVSTEAGSAPKPRLWLSGDGRSWSEVELQLGPGASVQALAPLADGSLMILGTLDSDPDDWRDPVQPAAWTSMDAAAWSPVALPLEAVRDWGAPQFAAGAEGVLVTIDDRIWHSPDGRSWQMVYDAPRGTSLYGPVAGDEGWIVRRGNASLGTATLLVSGDTVTWYEVDLGNVGTISTVAGDWLASRWTDDWERTEILSSANGLDWHVILDVGTLPVEPSDEGTYDGATMSGTDELLVLSPWQAGHCYSMPAGQDVFWSRDASTWVSAGLVEGAVVTHALEVGDVSVLVGYLATTGDVAFWSSTR